MYVLAEITERMSNEHYIKVHSASVKNLIERAHQTGRIERLEYAAMEPSADVLLQVFRGAKNADIARTCLEMANKQ